MINNTEVQNTYTTNGNLNTVYPITFQGGITESGEPHLQVMLTADETTRELVFNVDYTLAEEEIDPLLNQNESMAAPTVIGIKLVSEEDAAAGNELVITRTTPLTQDIDFQVGRIDPEQVEKVADLSVLRDQEIVHRMEEISDVADEALETATEGVELATAAQEDIDGHEADLNNPHQTSLAKLTDTEIAGLAAGHFLMYDGLKWTNTVSSGTVGWGAILGTITDQTDLMNTFVKKTGDTLSGMYKHEYGSRTRYMSANNPNTYADVIMNGDVFQLYYHYANSVTASLSMRAYNNATMAIYPDADNYSLLGLPARRFAKVYTAQICADTTGYNYLTIPVPSQPDTLATLSDVALAANSGTQLYTTGVWYAKMYAASTVPTGAEYDGRNYADFSQVDSDNNPIIVIYEGQSGAWVELTRITPPANYNGYITVTSKIWDIAEQSGQQGGQVLWSHSAKTFTPYPRIISFEDAALTGTPTAPNLDSNSPNNQIVNKASAQAMIDTLDTPELFDYKWKDCLTSKTTWKLADGSWITKAEAPAAYQQLLDEYNNATVKLKKMPTNDINNEQWYGCAYYGVEGNSNSFMAITGNGTLARSMRGNTWTLSSSQLLGNLGWRDIVYTGVGYGGKWVAISYNGYVANITSWSVFSTSTPLGSNNWAGLAWNGSKLVALGANGHISTSTDGETWTTPTVNDNLATELGWKRIAWNGSMFLAVNEYGYVSTSPDGETWSVPEHTSPGSIYGITVYKGKFYITSSNGAIYMSLDGSEWTFCYLAYTGLTCLVSSELKLLALSSVGVYSWPFVERFYNRDGGQSYSYDVWYYMSDNNKKITIPELSANSEYLYNVSGNSWFYELDTANEKFMLPRRRSQKIVRSVSNSDGSWYRLYADGWVEQGGMSNAISVAGNSGTNIDITLPITMADTKYSILTTRKDGGSGFAQTEENTNIISTSVIRITLWNNVSGTASGGQFWWQVSGMSAEDVSDLSEEKYLYFYVGA